LGRTTPDGTWEYSRTQVSGQHWQTTLTNPQQTQTVMDFQGIYETQRDVVVNHLPAPIEEARQPLLD